MKRPVQGSVAALIGNAIGAGIFGIPFVLAQSGVLVGIIHISVIALIVGVSLLAYGAITFRTSGVHQFPGYIQQYLGPFWKWVSLGVFAVGIYGALTAYTSEVGHLLFTLFGQEGGSAWSMPLLFSFLFWAVGVASVLAGTKFVFQLETAVVFGIICIVALLIIFGAPSIDVEYLMTVPGSVADALLPYGVILFAFGAYGIIPEITTALRSGKAASKFPLVVWVGIGVVALMYMLVGASVVGITGPTTSQSAVDGLAVALGPAALIIGAIFGILAMGSSFVVLGIALVHVFQLDLHLNRWLAAAIAFIPPLIIAAGEFASFTTLLGIVGGIAGGFQLLLLWVMYHRMRARVPYKKRSRQSATAWDIAIPTLVQWVIAGAFILGIIYQVLQTFGIIGSI